MLPGVAYTEVVHPDVGPMLRAGTCVGNEELRGLLAGIRAEDCAHTWKNFPPDGSVDDLVAWENDKRPTTIFFYRAHAEDTDRLEVAAAATVADAIQNGFPFPGFPVLARCYVRPKFRNRGLYRALVRHRLDFCRGRFGQSLKAVHMGTAEDKVAAAICRLGGDWQPFLRMGVEALGVGDGVRYVGGYVMFLPAYATAITASLAGADAPPDIVSLRRLFEDLLDGKPCRGGDYYNKLADRFEDAHSKTDWFDDRDPQPLLELLELCRSIPLVRSSTVAARAMD